MGRSYLEDVARQVLAVVDAAVHVDELVQRRLLLHRRVVQAVDRERERGQTPTRSVTGFFYRVFSGDSGPSRRLGSISESPRHHRAID